MDTSSYLVSYHDSTNAPTFTSIANNSLVYANNKSFNGLSLPSTSDTSKQYVLKLNSDGSWRFSDFVVTSDMEVSQSPSQWNLYQNAGVKLTTDGILVSADNGDTAYTVDIKNAGFCAFKYNNTTKKIQVQSIYQGPKDWTYNGSARLDRNGIVMSVDNGAHGEILEVTGNSVYGLTKDTTTNLPKLTSINNHAHDNYKLVVNKRQTTADSSDDTCLIGTTSKPYYIVNESGSVGSATELVKGVYLMTVEIDLVCLTLSNLQKNEFTFMWGINGIADNEVTIDQKMANRVNIVRNCYVTLQNASSINFVIGNTRLENTYKWDKITIFATKIK